MKKDTWVTREGQSLSIKDMASSHLLATVHYIERNRFTSAIECAMREPRNMDPRSWEDTTLQYYLQWPEAYDALIAEAQRRGLVGRVGKQAEGLVRRKRSAQ